MVQIVVGFVVVVVVVVDNNIRHGIWDAFGFMETSE
jgi:hypothetical protein